MLIMQMVRIYRGAVLLAVAASFANAGTPGFLDKTAQAQVNAQQVSSPFLHFYLGGGGGVADFNRDGHMDFFATGGGGVPDSLWINNGDGTFTDEAAAWGVAVSHLSGGVAIGDINNDGWPDIHVTVFGSVSGPAAGFHRLYRNNGDGTFTNIAQTAGVNYSSPALPGGSGAAFGDYDLDGDLDLVTSVRFGSQGNRLFRNNGDETFTDVTSAAELVGVQSVEGFAPRLIDMNGDRYPELVFIGDTSTTRYYVNDGDGTFTDQTAMSNMVLGESEMGFTCGDYDGDGDFDAYVTTKGRNNLYMNQGGHVFIDEGQSAGVKFTGWGWGAITIDFDHDTRPDLLTHSQITGNPNAHPWAFRNITPPGGAVDFENVTAALGFPTGVFFNDGRGLARLDYDNDGDQDFIAFNYNEPAILFENMLTGSDINWIRIFLDSEGAAGIPRNGCGAVIRVTVSGKTLIGRIDGGTNYLSVSEDSAHFGLGGATMIDEIRVEWTDGSVTTVTGVAANQTLTLTPTSCIVRSDATADGAVNFDDLNLVLANWGAMGAAGDVNFDGVVDFADLNLVLGDWGDACP